VTVASGRSRGRRRLGAVTSALLAVLALVVTILAVMDKGYAGSEVHTHNGGVWVLNTADGLLGRINVDAQEFDARLRVESTQDVLQSGSAVFLRTTDGIERVNTAAQRRESRVPLAGTDLVALGGDRAALLNADGKLWILSPDELAAFDPQEATPVATLSSGSGAQGTLTVTTSGDVYVLDGDSLLSFPRAATAAATTAEDPIRLTGLATGEDDVAMTAVGDQPVVLDRAHATLHVGTDDTVIGLEDAGVGDAGTATLQQPSPTSSHVLLATGDSLYAVPLSGGAATRDKAKGSGSPVAPVQAGGCDYAAWNGAQTYLTRCGDAPATQARVPDAAADADLRLRTNHDLVVLNDQLNGTSWMIADDMQIVDEWELTTQLDIEKQLEEQKETLTSSVTNVPPDQREENRDPVANPDAFGVRPGASVVLPVISNDTDPDGDVLIASVDTQPGIGTVTPIRGGTALQIDVAADAAGTAAFSYSVEDGRGGRAATTVELTVHADGTNEGPRAVDDSPPQLHIAQGAEVSFNVLPHYEDPDGDDFYLAGASIDNDDDQVTFRPDGMVTFTDAGLATGLKTVELRLHDAQGATSEGTLLLDVAADPEIPPITTADHAQTVAGRTVTLDPLLNDLNPSGGQLTLLHVGQAEGLTAVADAQNGTIDITGTDPATRYLTYQVGEGAQSVQGLIRVDVREPTSQAMEPVTVDDLGMVTTGSSTLVDPLENDVDPTGGVLVVDRFSAPEDSGLTAELIDHHYLRVSARADAPRSDTPVEVGYRAANATGTKEGTVRVMVVPPEAQPPYPVAGRDQALVRAGDAVKIPVLDNDRSPSGAPLEIDAISSRTGLEGRGEAEIVEDQIRFIAQDGASGTATFAYDVVDDTGRRATAEVTVRIVAADDPNDAPQPENGEARAIAGTTVRIPVRTSGIDPDGDSTLLTSITAPAPTLGRVTSASGEWIEYEAFAGSVGTDTIAYQVRDRFGGVGTAQIAVGVAKPSGTNLEPVAVDDTVRVRPDREVQVFVLGNDADPEGASLAIDRARTVSDDEKTMPLDEPDDRERIPAVSTRSPATPGAYTFSYGASDGQLTATGHATVVVDEDAPLLPPLARDDYVDPQELAGADEGHLTVDVLANDQDPDGSVADLRPALAGPVEGATVRDDGTIDVPVTTGQQRIRYTITDQDGGTSAAFIWVPGTDAQAPRWIGQPVEARAGEPIDIAIDDPRNVLVRAGAAGVTITDPTTATAQHADGTELVEDASTLRYTAREDYVGPDQVAVEVTDAADASDEKAARGTLVIPIEVTSSTNHPPSLEGAELNVVQGEAATPLELSAGADDPDGDTLRYAAGQFAPPDGVTVDVAADGTMLVEAAADAAKGTTVDVPVSADDGQNDPVSAVVHVTVVGSRQSRISTGVDEAVVDAGSQTSVPVLANDSNPFPGKPRTVLDPQVVAGQVTARVEGEDVVLAAPPGWHGSATVTYRVQDATRDPDRVVTGTIHAAVRDVPGAPSAPRIDAVGDGTATVSFTPGDDNGAPIDHYTVTSASGGPSTTTCTGTTCEITGLSNGTEYTFAVSAHNAVGDSAPSTPSAVARPDVRPDPPSAPTVRRQDSRLDVSWTPPVNRGSAIDHYELQILDAGSGASATRTYPASATSITWEGLTNGTSYTFRLRAFNGAPDPSDWSPSSAPEHPAGLPTKPRGTPSAQRVNTVFGGGVTVSFPAMSAAEANGEPITAYVVRASDGTEVTVGGDQTSATFQGLDPNGSFTFTYVGVNSVGRGTVPSAASDAVEPYAVPEAPQGVAAEVTEPHGRATVRFRPATTRGTDLTQYVITYSGGSMTVPIRDAVPGADGRIAVTVTGLGNGTAYSFKVQADNGHAGGQSPLSAASNSVVPYTDPQAPSVTATADSCTDDPCSVTFTAAANGSGGADPVSLSYSLDGGAFEPYRKAVTVAGSGAKHSITVRATNAQGLTADASASATAARPQPALMPGSVTWGAKTGVVPGCESGICRYVGFTLEHLEPGRSYTVTLSNSEDPNYLSFDLVAGADGRAVLEPNRTFYGQYESSGIPLVILVDGTEVGRAYTPYP